MPEQHGKIKEEKHFIWALPLWLKMRGNVSKPMVKYHYIGHSAFSAESTIIFFAAVGKSSDVVTFKLLLVPLKGQHKLIFKKFV